MLSHSHPEEAARLMKLAEQDIKDRWAIHENLVKRYEPAPAADAGARSPA